MKGRDRSVVVDPPINSYNKGVIDTTPGVIAVPLKVKGSLLVPSHFCMSVCGVPWMMSCPDHG